MLPEVKIMNRRNITLIWIFLFAVGRNKNERKNHSADEEGCATDSGRKERAKSKF